LPCRRSFAIFRAARAGIAQLVERQLPKLDVAGSNPVARSNSAIPSEEPAERGSSFLESFGKVLGSDRLLTTSSKGSGILINLWQGFFVSPFCLQGSSLGGSTATAGFVTTCRPRFSIGEDGRGRTADRY
jgi:hypothetical protein